MQQNSLNQAIGCLKIAIFHLLLIIFACWTWYVFIGRKGILAGIATYLSIFSGKAFLRVFGRVEKRPLVSTDDQPPTNP